MPDLKTIALTLGLTALVTITAANDRGNDTPTTPVRVGSGSTLGATPGYTTAHIKEGIRLPYGESRHRKHLVTREEGLAAVAEAYTYMGVGYVWGAESRTGIDCSGLILNAYRKANPDMLMQSWVSPAAPDATAMDMFYYNTLPITLDEARAGDLIFWTTSEKRVDHVVMVKSRDKDTVTFINATTRFGKVVEETWRLDDKWFTSRYVGTGRLLYIRGTGSPVGPDYPALVGPDYPYAP